MKTRNTDNKSVKETKEELPVYEGEDFFVRPSTHSHITRLSELDNNSFTPFPELLNFFRALAAGLRHQHHFQVLLTGPAATGKSALVSALAKELATFPVAESVPVRVVSGQSLSGDAETVADSVADATRACTQVFLQEEVALVEGEVVALELGLAQPGAPSHGSLTLRTAEVESVYRIGPELARRLAQEHVSVGDVVQVCKTSGELRRLGRSRRANSELDVYNAFQTFLPLPTGELQKRAEQRHVMSLSEIDRLNEDASPFSAVFVRSGAVCKETRKSVNEQVREWTEQGRAFVRKGLLVVEEADSLGEAEQLLLRQAVADSFAPSLLLVTSKERETRNGRFFPFGIAFDLLADCLVVKTQQLDSAALAVVVRSRVSEAAAGLLEKVVSTSGLHFAMRVAGLAASKVGFDKDKVGVKELEQVLSVLGPEQKAKGHVDILLDDRVST